ncbi:MAG: hypothetical protein F6K28_51325, partial [Microcoleus sp. SIO2G3]|nr:hypothetical protein [Microcoleus sp. SIO2G3]
IAQDNSFAVRDARYARGLSRFKDAIMIEAVLGSTSDFTHSPRHSNSSNDITDTQGLTITIDPVYLISAFQQERSLIARVREARNQTRVSVIQNYVAYVQAHQAATLASRQLDTVVASLPQVPPIQVASALLQPSSVPISHLASNPDYVAAANQALAANGEEMIALETLAATVGLPPEETLAVIQETIAQAQAQPIAAIEPAPLLENDPQQSVAIEAQAISTVSPSQP